MLTNQQLAERIVFSLQGKPHEEHVSIVLEVLDKEISSRRSILKSLLQSIRSQSDIVYEEDVFAEQNMLLKEIFLLSDAALSLV